MPLLGLLDQVISVITVFQACLDVSYCQIPRSRVLVICLCKVMSLKIHEYLASQREVS